MRGLVSVLHAIKASNSNQVSNADRWPLDHTHGLI